MPTFPGPRPESSGWSGRAPRIASDLAEQVRAAMKDLGLDRGRVGFDDEGFGRRLGLERVEIADGYDPLMHARAVKTPAELELLARATRLNEKAIRRTVSRWEEGWTRQDLNHTYAVSAVELGGFVRDPGALVVSHGDPARIPP